MSFSNAIEKAEGMAEKIDKRYSISLTQITELSKYYHGRFEYGLALFRLGYMQGMKAAKAEQKRKAVAHE